MVGLAGFEPAISCTPSKRFGLAELQSDGVDSLGRPKPGSMGGDRETQK